MNIDDCDKVPCEAIRNEREWRTVLMAKIDKIDTKVSNLQIDNTGLKIKMGMISSLCGIVAGVIAAIVSRKIGT